MLAFSFKPYIAVIGDIKSSKHLQDRLSLQNKLKNILETLNREYGNDIASNFMITLGDEFQGLLKNGRSAVYMMDRIERELYPVKLRFGIGVGEITTEIQPSMPLGADGPAYYLARERITTVKQSETKKRTPLRNTAISIQGHEEISSLLNTIFILLSELKENWTGQQVEIMNLYANGEYTQDAIAEKLNVNQSSVQRALAASGYYAYREALDTVSALLSEIREDDHV